MPSNPPASAPTLTDPGRRAQLLSLKLRALVRDNFDLTVETAEVTGFPWGGGLYLGGAAYVLAEDAPDRSLGPSCAWALRRGAARLHVLVTGAAGTVARRATYLARPAEVWQIDGRCLVRAEPAPFPPVAALDERLEPLIPMIEAAGIDPVVEHGVLSGEILGLEMARAVLGDDGVPRLEVGVGRHDREAFALLHGDLPPAAALLDVIDAVRRYRFDGGPPHPLNALAAERRLRARICAQPDLVGARVLAPAPPPVPRLGVKDSAPAIAVGIDHDGADVVLACSTGVDLDLAPFGADARAALGRPTDRLVLAVPARDALEVQRELAALLRVPAELRAVTLG